MVITGSAILVEKGSEKRVLKRLEDFPEITLHAASASGTELVVNIEAEDHDALERQCSRLKDEIPQILDITHLYVNFEGEIEKLE